jgi:hypothetical protein
MLFVASETVDRLQLSVGPNFSITPWHQALYVSYVSDVCVHLDVTCVSSGCCICYIGYTRRLHVYVLNVFSVSDVCCKCFIYTLYMLQ